MASTGPKTGKVHESFWHLEARYPAALLRVRPYSHSMVPGGFDVTS